MGASGEHGATERPPTLPAQAQTQLRWSRERRSRSSTGDTGVRNSALLTPAKLRLLEYLAECRLLSLPQLAWLNECGFGASVGPGVNTPTPVRSASAREKSARRHLRVLFDAGLVDVLPVSRAALAGSREPDAPNDATLLYGSAPNVYAPTRAGLRLLYEAGRIGWETRDRPLPAYGPRNGLFLAHELIVRDVRVWLERGCRRAEAGAAVIVWRDGTEAAIALGDTAGRLCPDAWVALRLDGQGAALLCLVEVDRGTERGTRRWDEKLAAYGALFDGDRAALRAATGYDKARVLVVTPGVVRRDALAAQIKERSRAVYERLPWLAGRFWLAEESVLRAEGAVTLSAPLWRQPGGPALVPAVPPAPLEQNGPPRR